MKFKTTYTSYCATGIGTKLHTGVGEVHGLIFSTTNATAEAVTIYDNTTASGNILIKLNLTANTPVVIFFPPHTPLRYSTALYVSNDTNVCGFVIHAY